MKRRWKVERTKKTIIIPTLREKIELGLTDEEWIMTCFIQHQNSECFREANAQVLCRLCPKSGKVKIEEERLREIETSLAKIMKRLARTRRYRRR